MPKTLSARRPLWTTWPNLTTVATGYYSANHPALLVYTKNETHDGRVFVLSMNLGNRLIYIGVKCDWLYRGVK